MKLVVFLGLVACSSSSPQQETRVPSSSPVIVPSDTGAVELPAEQVGQSLKTGDSAIVPDDIDRVNLPVGSRATGRFQLCLDEGGKPSSVAIVSSTGLPGYDRKIVARMRAWVFDPIAVDGKPAKVCTVLTIAYEQKTPVRIEQH